MNRSYNLEMFLKGYIESRHSAIQKKMQKLYKSPPENGASGRSGAHELAYNEGRLDMLRELETFFFFRGPVMSRTLVEFSLPLEMLREHTAGLASEVGLTAEKGELNRNEADRLGAMMVARLWRDLELEGIRPNQDLIRAYLHKLCETALPDGYEGEERAEVPPVILEAPTRFLKTNPAYQPILQIVAAVAERWCLSQQSILSKGPESRSKILIDARRECYREAFALGFNMTQIGAFFGRDRSTISNALNSNKE